MRTKIRQLPVVPQSPLPPLYAAWMDEVLGGPIPNETDATCDNCAMLPDNGAEHNRINNYFNSQTKCCTYLPELNNFLAGRILSDDDSAFAKGRATVETRLKAGVGITPMSIGIPQLYTLKYQNSPNLFGRAGSMRCPHYLADEGGRCGVWKSRNSVCATWYCKFVRGERGAGFWRKLLDLLFSVERHLSLWCIVQLDVGTDALQALMPLLKRPQSPQPTAGELDGKFDAELYRAQWGKWFGRETEFYKECASLVNKLRWKDVQNICGPELQVHTRLLQEAYQKLISDEIPERLKVGTFQILSIAQGGYLVTAYSGYDTIRLSQPLMNVLPYFDGRLVSDVLDDIVEKEKLRVSPSLLRKLIDFGMLIEWKNESKNENKLATDSRR